MNIRILLILFTYLFFAEAHSAEQEAHSIAAMMQQAKYSNGFEARLNISVTKANGAQAFPLKLAVIGQVAADKQRVVIRGISPDWVREQYFAVEQLQDGRIKAVQYQTAKMAEFSPFDVNAKLLESNLVAWDMLSPWWGWPTQIFAGRGYINGRDCINIRSINNNKNAAIREVESCVDQQAKVSLKTRLFGAQQQLLRMTTVVKLMAKGEEGAMIAKKLTIQEAGKMRTEIEVYAGDDQYQVSPETFAALDRPTS
ncbi:MAG: hypothetical protein WCI39_01005 [Gallionellaceae bacterium]